MTIGDSMMRWRTIASIVAVLGAVASVWLEYHVGRRNPSIVLMLMFAAWVLGPFVALLAIDRVWKGMTDGARKVLYALMLALAVGSVAVYSSVAFGPPRPRPAFWFLIVPALSWLLIVTTLPIAAKAFRRGSDSA